MSTRRVYCMIFSPIKKRIKTIKKKRWQKLKGDISCSIILFKL